MKILLTYASAGSGHLKAAQALYSHIKENSPGIELRLTDVLGKTNPAFRFSYARGYSLMVRYSLWAWRIAFWITSFKVVHPLIKLIAGALNRLNTRSFSRFLIQENPDFIISTHFLPSDISSRLKKAKKIKSRIITIITDFGVHPYWVSGESDIYVVASEATKRELVLEGVPENKIKEFGMPVDAKFLKPHDRGILSRKLGIEEDKFTVLIISGSFGLGPLDDIAESLCKDAQVLVVCANNKRIYKRLVAMRLEGVRVFGFVDNIQELMAVSDIIITKPGGLTISEAMNMELVPIFISPIPGQEEDNAQILKGYGIGFIPQSTKEIKKIVLDLKNNPHRLESVKENIRALKKPNALREICNVICQGSAGPCCRRPF